MRTINIYLLIIGIMLTLFSCQSESLISPRQFLSCGTDPQSEVAQLFLSLIKQQEGSYQRLINKLGSNTPLLEYTKLGSSTDFGLYYAMPYLDGSNLLSGCIIYPIDENQQMKDRSYGGILGNPINLNHEYLQNEIPITRRFPLFFTFSTMETGRTIIEIDCNT